MVALWGGAVSYERGTPVRASPLHILVDKKARARCPNLFTIPQVLQKQNGSNVSQCGLANRNCQPGLQWFCTK